MSKTQNNTAELVPIREYDGKQAVSGRDLHAFLQVGRDYTNWFKQMAEYGFADGLDFTPISAESTGGRPRIDHAMTIDMAKHVGMVQRSERGKRIREYFIEVEKRAVAPAPVQLDRRQLAQMVLDAEDAREAAEQRALAATAHANVTQKILDNVEMKDGLVVRTWIGKYFQPRQEGRIWELFYTKKLLKDGRGMGGTDRKGKRKSSRDHQLVYTDGFPYFIRPEKDYQVGDGVTRYETRVRPGRAELELVAYCERAGIEPLPEVSQALFEINDLSNVFTAQKELAA